jgi:hypothetical protein
MEYARPTSPCPPRVELVLWEHLPPARTRMSRVLALGWALLRWTLRRGK